MDIQSIALVMYPYWLLGILMLWATIKAGYKDLIKIDKKAVFSWVRFLCMITLIRIVMFKLFPAHYAASGHNFDIIPWPLTLTVFWEDACHGLPLLLTMAFLGTKKWTWPIHGLLTAIVMVSFGLGHVYQGVGSAILLSFYVPYSIRIAKKFGYGTVMICHTLWDLTTILSMKWLLGM